MSTAAPHARTIPLNFQIGARTLMAIQRTLLRVSLGLDDAQGDRLPVLPPLARDANGYSVTSLPEDRLAAMTYASSGMIPFVRQRYTRYFAGLEGGYDAYLSELSANTRQGMKRKAKKIAQVSGGDLDVRAVDGVVCAEA